MPRATTPPTAGSDEEGAKGSGVFVVWSDFQGDKAMPQGDEAQEGEEATTAEATSSTEGGGEGGYWRRRRRSPCRPYLFGYPRGAAPWRKDSHRVPGLQKTMLCRFWIRGEHLCRRGQFCTYAHGEAEVRPAPGHFKITKSLKTNAPIGENARGIV